MRLSREDQRGGSTSSSSPVTADKASRWMERRKARRAQFSALDWGHSQGLRDETNPLMFQNRDQYNNIARWLSAAAAAEDGGVGPMGPDVQRGTPWDWHHSGPYETSGAQWSNLGNDLRNGWNSAVDWHNRQLGGYAKGGYGNNVVHLLGLLGRAASGGYDR